MYVMYACESADEPRSCRHLHNVRVCVYRVSKYVMCVCMHMRGGNQGLVATCTMCTLCVCIYPCIYVCMYAHADTCLLTYTHTCIHTCLFPQRMLSMYFLFGSQEQVHAISYIHTYIHACIHTYTNIPVPTKEAQYVFSLWVARTGPRHLLHAYMHT